LQKIQALIQRNRMENTRLILENGTLFGAIKWCTIRTLVSPTMGNSKFNRWS